jgi:hypothetical protein
LTAIIVLIVLGVAGYLAFRQFWVPSRNKRCPRCDERTTVGTESCPACGYTFHVRDAPPSF